MAVTYKLVEKVNPGNLDAPRKWYAQAKSTGEITLRQLSRRIAEMSTVSSTDVMAVLESLLQILPMEITDGNIVRLGDFGSFCVKVNSEGVEKKEDFTSSNIKRTLPVFKPGKEVKKVMRAVDYRKI